MDLVLSRSYMTIATVWGPSRVSGIFLAFIRTRGFGPFLELSELLHTGLGFVDNFEGISGIYQKM